MSPILSLVRTTTLQFPKDLTRFLRERHKTFEALRVRIVAFRDFEFDADRSIELSGFYGLPTESQELHSFLLNLSAFGGGDEPESGLEALGLAIKSEWNQQASSKRRQIIMVFTDASAHELKPRQQTCSTTVGHLDGLPQSYGELTALWQGPTMSSSGKRLVLFAPDCYPWSAIGSEWENSVHVPHGRRRLVRVRLPADSRHIGLKHLSHVGRWPLLDTQNRIRLTITKADLLKATVDVLSLRYDGKFAGSEWPIFQRLQQRGVSDEQLRPAPGSFRVIWKQGVVRASHLLLIGINDIGRGGYSELNSYSRQSLQALHSTYRTHRA